MVIRRRIRDNALDSETIKTDFSFANFNSSSGMR
jgi:hypothetical protein